MTSLPKLLHKLAYLVIDDMRHTIASQTESSPVMKLTSTMAVMRFASNIFDVHRGFYLYIPCLYVYYFLISVRHLEHPILTRPFPRYLFMRIRVLSLFFLTARVIAEQVTLFANLEEPEKRIAVIERDAPFIFNSLLHLLRQWGTTQIPNGFSFTPGIIPAHTPLYHGRKDEKEPLSPEWLAFDSQMSIGIMLTEWGETFLRTYISTRPLSVLYIDGMSAALTPTGTLDSQHILLYGEARDDSQSVWDEYGRGADLCAWGQPLGVEGFVRTNAGFELLWCDFDTGLQFSQNLNVSDWWTAMSGQPLKQAPWGKNPRPPTRGPSDPPNCPYEERCPPDRSRGAPFWSYTAWEWLRAATEVYGGAGEERVILDTSRMITAYGEPDLPDLGRDMAKHRMARMSNNSMLRYQNDVMRAANSSIAGSGIDWRRIAGRIATTYGRRLPEIRLHLGNQTESALKKARIVAISLVMPFINFHGPSNQSVAQCTRGFTSSIDPQNLAWSEFKLLTAIETIHARICTTVFGFYEAFRELQPVSSEQSTEDSGIDWKGRAGEWQRKFIELEQFLDWKMWNACKEVCKPDEVCYQPIWPVARTIYHLPGKNPTPDEPFEPHCVNVDWYAFHP